MGKLLIKSLGLEVTDCKIITDIDDCIFYTSREILKHGINKTTFWFDDSVYEKYKHTFFENAELTEWGKELLALIKEEKIKDFQFITAAKNRMDILTKKLNIEESFITQEMSDLSKIDYINSIKEKTIYVDDKLKVISQIQNSNIIKINYPKSIIKNRPFYSNRFRRKF